MGENKQTKKSNETRHIQGAKAKGIKNVSELT